MIAVGTVQAGEAGVEIPAVEEGGDGPACAVLGTADRGGSLRVKGGLFRRVIVEDLPDGTPSRWDCIPFELRSFARRRNLTTNKAAPGRSHRTLTV